MSLLSPSLLYIPNPKKKIREQWHHVIDITPTILEAVGIKPPSIVNGVAQRPHEGTSMMYTFLDKGAESTREVQVGVDGWMCACMDGYMDRWMEESFRMYSKKKWVEEKKKQADEYFFFLIHIYTMNRKNKATLII